MPKIAAPFGIAAPSKTPASLNEVFATSSMDGAALGFVLAHIEVEKGPVLWAQDRLSLRESGRPYLAGMPAGMRVILVDVSRAVDVLWAMEEGLRSPNLAAVIGEIWGDPPALSFTASKRLVLRAQNQKTPTWLIRRGATPNLSAARMRWRLSARASTPPQADMQSPGPPRWDAHLFRAHHGRPGRWTVDYDSAKRHMTFEPLTEPHETDATQPSLKRHGS